jgi:C1A family cysteine protease
LDCDFNVFEGVVTEGCPAADEHSLLLVGSGFDEVQKVNFWLLQNSWGPSWGENGYIRIMRERGTNTPGMCGIAMKASYPI